MKKLIPFSTDVVFFDTEFTSLDPYSGELLSFGAVKPNGQECYVEIENNGPIDDWVRDNILPTLVQEKLPRNVATAQISEFIGPNKPFGVAFVDNYDTIYSNKLFSYEKLPFDWMTVDFSTVLFTLGYNPRLFLPQTQGSNEFYTTLGIEFQKFHQHHALEDARLLKEVWMKFFES